MHGGSVPNSRPLSFMVTLTPSVEFQPSNENLVGNSVGDEKAWANHKFFYQISTTRKLCVLECGMKILSCFLPEEERVQHIPCVMSGDWIFSTFYDVYAHIVCKLMSLPICLATQKAKWKPILIVKNMLVTSDVGN